MKWLDLTFSSPAENLACDEALLDVCENGESEDVLRFWESDRHFVVVGYANRIAAEVNGDACKKKGVPILRRCSGGGAVLQGPGCLNYTLVLRMAGGAPLHSISAANRFIMERNRTAMAALLPHSEIRVCGHTDLAAGGRKFSGNSQRRRKNFLLFHGTFLSDFRLPLIGEFLRMPSQQPSYRRNRGHGDFLANLKVPPARIKEALRKAWNATNESSHFPERETRRLAAEKYSSAEWNFKL